jgi:transcriptional regulator with XRE-family HTH domain
MTNSLHWTEKDTKKFQFAIALDFIDQLEARMAELKCSRSKLAKKAKVDKSYVSQVFNNPGNLSLETVVKFARALKMKVTVVAYDDGDESNERGPINAEIFRLCWEHAKKPADMWTFKENRQAQVATAPAYVYHVPRGRHEGARAGGRTTLKGAGNQVITRLGYSTPHWTNLLDTYIEAVSPLNQVDLG